MEQRSNFCLKLYVSLEDAKGSEEEIKSNLRGLVQLAMEEDLITSGTDATVEDYEFEVDEVDGSLDPFVIELPE